MSVIRIRATSIIIPILSGSVVVQPPPWRDPDVDAVALLAIIASAPMLRIGLARRLRLLDRRKGAELAAPAQVTRLAPASSCTPRHSQLRTLAAHPRSRMLPYHRWRAKTPE